MFEKLDEVESAFQDIEKRLTSPETISNQALFQKLSKEHKNLSDLVATYREYRKVKSSIASNEQIIGSESGELREMALDENKSLTSEIPLLEQRLRVLLLPKDPNDDKNILLEIRAGAGGDEAGIFAGDLYRMYSKYAEKRGWQVEVMSISENAVGGLKEVIGMIRGDRVYSYLKRESGVHRVQRVPKTETQGRIHTSTVTVAVLPEAEDVELNIEPNELRFDVFRSSGPGGQSVNTTDSAVRVTHIPSGMVVICRDEKSQHKNKSKALKILKTRLLDLKQQEQSQKIASDRLSQVGTGDRSEKIRTYNFPQGRITDHRIGFTSHQLATFMEGDIDEMVSKLTLFYEAEALQSQTEARR
ncbi:MAG: peptide chain release factor 1 [Deltaproteobacteria bacterium]|nr:peptide chain release factor 1 [Deltaproteobacteria bacterium]MBI3295535.1 peptide chain release factor 1 [Deltaproteobacteria bacterium]